MLRLLNPFGSNFNITVLVIFALQFVGEGPGIYLSGKVTLATLKTALYSLMIS